MLEFLDTLDRSLFLFINMQLANPVTDLIMPVITSDVYLRVLYGVTMVVLLWRGSATVRWAVLGSIVVLVLTDQLSAGLLKPMIGRARPCQVMDSINLLVGCGGGKAMPSAHAANALGQAAFFGILFRVVRKPLEALALLIAVSRVFVGVHYPGDVLAGAVIGTLIGGSAALAFRHFIMYREDRPRRRRVVPR